MKKLFENFSEEKGLQKMIESLESFAKENLKYPKDITAIILESDEDNAKNPLGRTAFYDLQERKIVVFTEGRHVKDILRSIAHELVHHAQNCSGVFDSISEIKEGYAQSNAALREAERDAYERGNMMFRDWEDSYKKKQKFSINESKIEPKKERSLEDALKKEPTKFTERMSDIKQKDMNNLFKKLMNDKFLRIEKNEEGN